MARIAETIAIFLGIGGVWRIVTGENIALAFVLWAVAFVLVVRAQRARRS